MRSLKLRPDVLAHLEEWNHRKVGRGINYKDDRITNLEVLDRLEALAFPGEDLNDTILRIMNQGGICPQ